MGAPSQTPPQMKHLRVAFLPAPEKLSHCQNKQGVFPQQPEFVRPACPVLRNGIAENWLWGVPGHIPIGL